MNTKLLYLLLPLTFLKCIASMSTNSMDLGLEKQLIKAIRNDSIDVVHNLLEKGADANAQEDRLPALGWAVQYHRLDCLKVLIDAKANVNALSKYGSTALHNAALYGHTDCVKALIEAKADVNVRKCIIGKTALHYAAMKGDVDCVKALIEAKADLNARAENDYTALHYAAMQGHVSSVKALIEAKADLNARDITGRTALSLAAMQGHVSSVKALIEAKTDLNAFDKDGNTALHGAAAWGHTDCLKALIEAKTDINTRDKYGRTALNQALMDEHTDCARALVKYSYLFVHSTEAVSQSRKRIFNVLLQFVRLRKQHPELENLKAESLQFEILSWNKLLQEDLVIILLDELKKGKEIKSAALIRSKESAVRFLLKNHGNHFSHYNSPGMSAAMKELCDLTKLEENFGALVREGLEERCVKLKDKSTQ